MKSLFQKLPFIVLISGAVAHGNTIFNDSWADGDLSATGASDTNWFTTTSSQAIEVSTGSMGLVTGTSGRGIHATFASQTLSNVGDSLTLSYAFSTPATVGSNSTALRFALFNSNSAPVGANFTSSTDPAWDAISGYMVDYDVNTGSDNINFRVRQSPTGSIDRLLSTTSVYDGVSGGGASYSFAANTNYQGVLSIEMTGANEISLTASLLDGVGTEISSYTATGVTASTLTYDFLGIQVNSNTFGSSSVPGEADNGLDFSNVNLEFTAVPEPSTYSALFGLFALAFFAIRRRKA